MCGITGYYSFDNSYDQEILESMNNELQHRGPDAGAVFVQNQVGLGHRRLSILDLSTNANQPMHSANGRFVMVYNGEIYNYKELANELSSSTGIKFKTTSDSEVILETIAHFGFGSVTKFNGMFAFAVYDKLNEELTVGRDRMGIKPLYYYWDKTNFVFASELKSFVKVKTIPKRVNKNAVYQYLHLGCIPAPLSIFENIHKLEAGKLITISQKKLHNKFYWDLFDSITAEKISDEITAKKQLDDLLNSSVELQMNSDVPFGVFLSGGIDSSLIAAKATQLSTNRVNTFSIGFHENKYNEAIYAKQVADQLKTIHHEFIVSYKDASDLVSHISSTYDEPFADPSAIPTILISQLTRKHVTVALSGEGGDELFFGYGAYNWAQRLNNPILKPFHKVIALTLDVTNRKRHAMYFKNDITTLRNSHIYSQEQDYFSSKEIDRLFKYKDYNDPHFFSELNKSLHSANRRLSAMEKQAIFDIKYTLQNDLLTKVDRASMRSSLEVRVPYLDNRIVDMALNLAPEIKYKNKTHKSILKQILFESLPEKMFDRPKQGFALPIEKWLKNELRYLIEETLSKNNIEKYNLVDAAYTSKLVSDFYSGKSHVYKRLWQLIILHQWMEKHSTILEA